MAERDRFELDLAAALRAYAVDAPTEVRPVEIARHFAETYPHRRGAAGRWSFGLSPALAWILLSIGLLVALVAGTLAVGSRLLESREPFRGQPPALLAGMVVEEVQPGVFRVVNDGVRDLSPTDALDVVAGYDGSIWLLGEEGFLRLGSDGSHEWPTPIGAGFYSHVLQVAPDGTLWVTPTTTRSPITGVPLGQEGLRSTDGETWSTQPCPRDYCRGVTVAPDGTLWAFWADDVECLTGVAEDCESWFGYLGPTGWQQLDESTSADDAFGRLIVTDAGDLYGVDCAWDCLLYRYGDGAWWQDVVAELVDVGPDGTVWRGGRGFADGETWGVARLTDGEWAGWTSAYLPEIQHGLGLDREFQVAPDGNLWFSLWRSDPGADTPTCGQVFGPGPEVVSMQGDGLARFDGVALDRFLPGRCISMDIAADGSVWVVAGDEDEVRDLYVITPGAVGR